MARAQSAPRHPPKNYALVCAIAWALPGAGHLWLRRRRTGVILLVALTLMFAIGLCLQGRLFSFDMAQPLVALAALAELGIGAPYLLAVFLGFGDGSVVVVTHEHGNTFLVAAGLLNLLVVLDVYDIVEGRK